MRQAFLLLLLCISFGTYAQRIKVACVGNSVTYGAGIENRETEAYPAQLQRLLGTTYDVRNFGKSGATLLAKGHRPYTEQDEYRAAIDFAADRVIIHLGLNDTDPRDWPNYRGEFVRDYLHLIDSFRQANPKSRIWICRLTPISHRHPRFRSGTRDWYWQIQEKIEEIATLSGATLVDLQQPLYNRPELLPDGLHPNAEGAGLIAQTIFGALTGQYGGLQLPSLYADYMVLQRNQPLRIAGVANAGEQVTVRIAGQQKEGTAAGNGQWEIVLDPLTTGTAYTLEITTPHRKLTFKHVAAGEVWVCSGQSNMAFRLDQSVANEREAQLVYARTHPEIRLFDRKPRWPTNEVEWAASTLDSLNRLDYYKTAQWTPCDEATATRFSAIAFAFGRMLSDSLQVPIGLILNAVGGSPAEAWIDRKTLEFDFPDILTNWLHNDFIQEWARGRAALNIRQAVNPLQRHPYEPTYLFESGIQPLAQYPIKGVIWYQGESNAHNLEAHERLFPLLVKSWRSYWKNNELPFYYVQLSSIDRPSWPWFRDSQRRLMQTIPHTGMAVSSDRGDSLDVHPRQKKDVGERLAHQALSQTYGHSLSPSGPLFRSVSFVADTAFVAFDYAEGLKTSDGEPVRTFEIAAHDDLFFPAQAEIVDGKAKIWSEKVASPRFVRYGWQPFTHANLVNGEGLPASTFRSTPERTTTHKQHQMIQWTPLPGLPGTATTPALGVSAPFTGVVDGKLIVAGGCNFPDKPVTEGGVKRYYREIFALDLTQGNSAQWQPAGMLPEALAYGAAVSTAGSLLCIGGNNNERSSDAVYRLRWNEQTKQIDITSLPSLPQPMDNFAAAAIGDKVYATGGNLAGQPTNNLFCLDLLQTDKGWTVMAPFPGPTRVQPVCVGQSTAIGHRLYLTGGFQPLQETQAAVIPTDVLAYDPATNAWTHETILPPFEDGSPRTLTGGCGVAWDGTLLFMGGVNYARFQAAIDRPRQIEQARATKNKTRLATLQSEAVAYMHHPVEWYDFNRTLLQYDLRTKIWTTLSNHEALARAGAGVAVYNRHLILVNGELKPGIRTPQVNKAAFPH